MKITRFELFLENTKDIITHPMFKVQKSYVHHQNVSIYEHVIMVSYRAHRIAKILHLDYKSTARGALLHDFFLYDWHIEGKRVPKKGLKRHGFTHAKIALDNAVNHFELNKKERDIIVKHMFPLNLHLPRYFESWLVAIVDTFVTLSEVFFKRKNEALLNFLEDHHT